MAKINDTSSYPTVTAASGDLIIGSDVSDSNATKTFTAQSIADLYAGASPALVYLEDITPSTGSRSQDSSITLDSSTYSGYAVFISNVMAGADFGLTLRLTFGTSVNQTAIIGSTAIKGDSEAEGVSGAIYITSSNDNRALVRSDLVYEDSASSALAVPATPNYLVVQLAGGGALAEIGIDLVQNRTGGSIILAGIVR